MPLYGDCEMYSLNHFHTPLEHHLFLSITHTAYSLSTPRDTFSALDCFVKSVQSSDSCDAATDFISKPISAISACAASALVELEQNSWMKATFGTLSCAFVEQMNRGIGRCTELISHLIAALEPHVKVTNSFFEKNTTLPFIIEQCSVILTLLQQASAACTPSSSSFSHSALGITPRPLHFSHITTLCARGSSVADDANLAQEHACYVEFCSQLSLSVNQAKGLLALPLPPRASLSQELSLAASAAQVVVSQAVQMNRSVCKMLLTLANLGLDLSTNGFCKPMEQEEGSDDGEGEGTGMGQGQGREDVSEEIENEGQMEGLQGEENKDPQQKKDPKSRGIEMEQVCLPHCFFR